MAGAVYGGGGELKTLDVATVHRRLVKVVLLHVLPGLDGRQDLKRIFGGRPINYEIAFIKLQPNRLKQISPFTLLYAWSLSAEEM